MVLNEQAGKRHSRGYESLGFVGAILLDLFLKGNLTFERKKVLIIDNKPTGDEYLDRIFEVIKNTNFERILFRWIDKLSAHYKKYYFLYLENMEQKGFLSSRIRPVLKTKLFYLKDPNIKMNLLKKINMFAISNLEFNIKIFCLLVLLDVSKLINAYISWNLRKKTRDLIAEILYSEQLDTSLRNLILGIRKEIINVVGARILSTTNGT
jgi:hypothetical protein